MLNLLMITAQLMTDGDAAFVRVDNRRPAHALSPGEVHSAVNSRFEQGEIWPRPGVALDFWGLPGRNLAAGAPGVPPDDQHVLYTITGLEVGETYLYMPNGMDTDNEAAVLSYVDSETYLLQAVGQFVATETTVTLYANFDQAQTPCTAILIKISNRTLGYGRFNNPAEADIGILLTDDWRENAGEDGGRGRAWRIQANNLPLEIPLNGHDVWDTCRLTQCNNAMVLHRHGNARHYFGASAVDTAADTITLNCVPDFQSGDLVEFNADLTQSSSITGAAAPVSGAFYYAKIVSGTVIELYTDAAMAAGQLDFDGAIGRFWLRRAHTTPGFFGNGAQNLILQPSELLNAFDNGWRAVAANVEITGTEAATDTLKAANHRLLPGDAVTLVSGTITGWAGTKYARPLSENVLELYDTADNALTLGSTSGRVNLTTDGQTGTLAKAGASKLPMPPLRESIYYLGRLIGINGRDNILISDPFDFLHFSLYTGTVPANLGESGEAQWLRVLGDDVLLVGRTNSVLALSGLTGSSANWRLVELTREYGGIAPLAALNVGSDVQFLSRKGWASVVRTIAGETLGQARTLSESIPRDLDAVDWIKAGSACAAFWNNRLLVSVPTPDQDEDYTVNDLTLAANARNSGLIVRQDAVGGEIVGGASESGAALESWEGRWTGHWLRPVTYAPLTVAGEEVMTFATPNGLVCWLDFNAWKDVDDTHISASATLRGYFGGRPVLVLGGSINYDAFNPEVTVQLKTAGYGEAVTLMDAKTYSNEAWLLHGASGNDFSQRGRAGYNMNPDDGLYTEGVPFDVHQNITEPLWARERDRSPQIVVSNAQESLRVKHVTLRARSCGALATTQV